MRFSQYSSISQTVPCLTPCTYAICCCVLKRPKLSKHWPFQCLPFMHLFLPQLCLLTVSVGSLSAASMYISLRFVEAEFPNKSRLWCFSITRGWRLTCRTGWTRHAPVTKGVSITMMKIPPSARVTPVPTDTELMSTTTTINSSHKKITGHCPCDWSKAFVSSCNSVLCPLSERPQHDCLSVLHLPCSCSGVSVLINTPVGVTYSQLLFSIPTY